MKLYEVIFSFTGKKIGHSLKPGTYTAVIAKSRINRAGNLEVTLAHVAPREEVK